MSALLRPRSLRLGDLSVIDDDLKMILTPVILTGPTQRGWFGPHNPGDFPHYIYKQNDTLGSYRIRMSDIGDGIDRTTTTLSFETTVLSSAEGSYEVRWFFQNVEWRRVDGKWTFGVAGPEWDEFVSGELASLWPSPEPFLLGIATYAPGPTDPEMQGRAIFDRTFLGGWYRI